MAINAPKTTYIHSTMLGFHPEVDLIGTQASTRLVPVVVFIVPSRSLVHGTSPLEGEVVPIDGWRSGVDLF